MGYPKAIYRVKQKVGQMKKVTNKSCQVCTVESILETEEFEFPAKTVFPNNLMNSNLRVSF